MTGPSRPHLGAADSRTLSNRMLFNTFAYAAFLPTTLAAVWLSPAKWRNIILLGASYVFYGAWDVRFLGLLLLSTITDFVVARRLEDSDDAKARRGLLLVSLTVNLGILGFFKYFGFFVESAATLLDTIGLAPNPPLLSIVLPVGISFYTFQTMSYSIDVYRGITTAERDLVVFALFVAFFPQLVAGPIERAQRLLPQLRDRDRRPSGQLVEEGLYLILMGLFKKVVIADTMAPIVEAAYRDLPTQSGWALLVAAYAFSLQIYGDFSGYTDIARGSAALLGIRLMVNFRQPYLATSITDFWRRWHISLSAWLKDYLYIPLGGNRRGTTTTYRNLIITMLLGGLWHGAAWTFVVWGGLHGTALAVHRRTRSSRQSTGSRRVMAQLMTFHLVTFLWVFFRAPDFSAAWEYSTRLITIASGAFDASALMLVTVAGAVVYWLDRSQERSGSQVPVVTLVAAQRGAVVGAATTALLVFGGDAVVPFIYFQF